MLLKNFSSKNKELSVIRKCHRVRGALSISKTGATQTIGQR